LGRKKRGGNELPLEKEGKTLTWRPEIDRFEEPLSVREEKKKNRACGRGCTPEAGLGSGSFVVCGVRAEGKPRRLHKLGKKGDQQDGRESLGETTV